MAAREHRLRWREHGPFLVAIVAAIVFVAVAILVLLTGAGGG